MKVIIDNAPLSAVALSAGLDREITDGSNLDDKGTPVAANPDQRAANRLQITYTGTIPNDNRAVITRVVNLVPIAANWCP